MSSFRPVSATLLVALFSLLSASFAWSNEVSRKPTPTWAVPADLPDTDDFPESQIQDGIYYLLVDTQVTAEAEQEPQYYHHYANHIINQAGVENGSQINIDYDPTYQQLTLHTLRIIRGSQVIDKIDSARMKVFQREEELDDLIYNGRMTANLILDDVRVGDTIEYSYSYRGANPVYQNIFAYRRYLNWTVPVGRLSLRVLWNKPTELRYRIENSDLQPTRRDTTDGSEYLIQGDGIEPVNVEGRTPAWFDPWGKVAFSELNSWQEVASWSRRLYQDVYVADESIKQLVSDIRSRNSGLEDRISAALRFAQDEVRYLGIELGQNSHKPTPAAETLRNRYGDCKDKTVLFIALLKEFGVDAYPALVNTEDQLDHTLPNIHAFDHVITYFEHDGKRYWVDPTRSYQHGGIDSIHQPDYGQALILREETRDLTPMSPNQAKHGVFVEDSFVLPAEGGEATFSSVTENYGWNAEHQRRHLADKGRDRIQNEYLEFFQDYYPGAAVAKPIEYSDDPQENRLTSREQYRISDFWKDESDKRRFEADFYANVVSPALTIPNERTRRHPLAITYPEHIEQVIELNFEDDNWNFDNDTFEEDNDYFRFNRKVTFDPSARKLTLVYQYASKTDNVPPSGYGAYLAALERVDSYQHYGIYKSYPAEPVPWYGQYLTVTNILLAYAGLYLLVFLLWRLDRKRHPDQDDSLYFPVSPLKLIVMWLLTFGLYGSYWFYRNFRYIKEQEGNASMPVARAIFHYFWYYPLWRHLGQDSEERYGKSHLPGKALAGLLALLFFVAITASSKESLLLPSLLFGALLVLPLSNYIQYVNGQNSAMSAKNSKWHLRHLLLLLLSLPLYTLSVGSEVGILASDSVVKGDHILDRDIKFMQRQGILKPSDDIEYFYSDAFLFIRDDGNGFTQRHVFSYWKDENEQFRQEQADFDEIKDIQVNWSRKFGENSTITVVRNDDSEFVLFVSHTDLKDKLFIDALQSRWRRYR